MKVTYQNRRSVWNYFSDFSNPDFFSNPLSLKSRQCKKQPSEKFVFVHKLIRENKLKNLYRRLDALYHASLLSFENETAKGEIPNDLHPRDEQLWFIEHLKTKVDLFSPEDAWLFIINHEERDKYAKYLNEDENVCAFELFLHNYLIQALSGTYLKEIFLIAYEDPIDRKSHLKKLFDCLQCTQVKCLFEALKRDGISYQVWSHYCQSSVEVMRNSQIKEAISFVPLEIECFALEKLYPCEILEIVDQEHDEKKKRLLIDKVLKNGKTWWSFFSRDEVNETYSLLLAKKS